MSNSSVALSRHAQYTISMSTSIREKIIAYLGQGIQQSVVATSCGVTPAYVSQLLEVPEVREEIAKLRAGTLEKAIEADSSLERIEKVALRMVEQKLPFVRNAVEAAKIFATLNAAKRKATPENGGENALAAQMVTITVPRAAALHFRISSDNQVIEVEGRAMAPLPSRALPALQKRLAAPGVADLVVTDVPAPKVSEMDAAISHRTKQAAADGKRATAVLADLTTYMDGVQVVL